MSISPGDSTVIIALSWCMLIIGLVGLPVLFYTIIIHYHVKKHGLGHNQTPPRQIEAQATLAKGKSLTAAEKQKALEVLKFTTTYQHTLRDYQLKTFWFGAIVIVQQLATAMFVAFLRFNEVYCRC